MKKIVLIIVIMFTVSCCNKQKIEEKQTESIDEPIMIDSFIIGGWSSYTNNYYTELYIDSTDIYGLYEDIGVVPPTKYKISNDSLIRFYDLSYKSAFENNARIEVVNDSTLLLLYNSNIDSAYLFRLPKQEFNVKAILNLQDEIKYMIGFSKRHRIVLKN